MLIAKIIVDVPTGATDRLFDYIVPVQWENIVEKGMRVGVPFGNRLVQGFVIELVTETTVAIDKLKPIKQLLDATPVLNEELLQLGDWLSETTLSFKISAYQVMLPAALKGKAKKEFVLVKENVPQEVIDYFGRRKSIPFDEMMSDSIVASKIKNWLDEQYIDLRYTVKNKATIKKQKMITLNRPLNEIDEFILNLSKRANKQKELLLYMKEHKEVVLTELIENRIASRATIKTLVEQNILREIDREIYRDPYESREFHKTEPLVLSQQQLEAITPIWQTIENEEHRTFLLHGVTGSGKTEIYLQAIDLVLKQGKEAIVLVPEISLTPQMVDRFKGRFGREVAVMHSGLSIGEKYDEWRKIMKKEVRVVVGARSAIFAPFENIGIIIIDEEHEGSYKQEENPRYHARDVAIYRAQYHRCPVVLGSATPSLESYARGLKGRYELVSLLGRINQLKMPEVSIVDMRDELRSGNRSMFSKILYEKIVDRLEKKEQIVLLLNRRGHSTFIMCRDCGYVPTCRDCDISLTFHKSTYSLLCHYCGYEEKLVTKCASCNSEHIRFFGTGTQKVEEELARILPQARVIRMDIDTTRRKGSHQKLLDAFANGEGDILLGTQMIAKGLDFPNITLVGVLAADSMLNIPDFRAAERTFQLLTQVSGRAGRHKLPGEVIVQTYAPEHYSINYVKEHDYMKFFHHEMHIRKANGYPPYYFITLIHISHTELPYVIHVAEKISQFLKAELSKETKILGPASAPIARMKDRYRYQCMIKYKIEPKLNSVLRRIIDHYSQEMSRGDLQIAIDPNPMVFM